MLNAFLLHKFDAGFRRELRTRLVVSRIENAMRDGVFPPLSLETNRAFGGGDVSSVHDHRVANVNVPAILGIDSERHAIYELAAGDINPLATG